jgi:hypothetical protein
MNFASAHDHQRFFIERGLRRRSGGGCGSDQEALMRLPRTKIQVDARELFGTIPCCVAGGIATWLFDRAWQKEGIRIDLISGSQE